MKMTIENTTKFVTMDGVEARVWEGTTEKGLPVHAFVVRVAADRDADVSELERDLRETRAPSFSLSVLPFRMVL